MIAKYLATSLAMLKVVSAPRVIRSCLPTSTTSISLVGLESRSTMLAASLAACVPVFIATPTSACASAGASLVPSPVIATRWPAACSERSNLSLSSGFACARKSSTPASPAMAAAVSALSPVIITVLLPLARDSRRGNEIGRLAIAEGDRPGFVQQKHINVACRLDRAPAHRQHVMLNHAVDPRDADRAEQPADRRWNQANQERDQYCNG